MKVTIELSKEQQVAFNNLKATREGRTDEQLLSQVMDRGLYDLNYRTKRNRQQWAEFKAFKQAQKEQA